MDAVLKGYGDDARKEGVLKWIAVSSGRLSRPRGRGRRATWTPRRRPPRTTPRTPARGGRRVPGTFLRRDPGAAPTAGICGVRPTSSAGVPTTALWISAWLISKGEKAYEEALKDPESLVKVVKEEDDDCQYEEFQHVASQVWRRRPAEGCFNKTTRERPLHPEQIPQNLKKQ